MGRSILAFILVLSFCHGFAQSWCPPGATWTYYTENPGGIVSSRRWQTGDTVMAGVPGQVLSSHIWEHTYSWQLMGDGFFPSSTITSYSNDIVSLWSHSAQAWDTVFWFGAIPGDTWDVAFNTCSPVDMIEVLDTGTTVISGVPLRYWDIRQNNGPGQQPPYRLSTITERLGWDAHMFPSTWCVPPDVWQSMLRCYTDQEIEYHSAAFEQIYGPIACDVALSQMDGRPAEHAKAFPNPGTDRFTLQLPSGSNTITVYDAVGRVVLTQRATGGATVINASSLQTGPYLVRVISSDRVSVDHRWVKH